MRTQSPLHTHQFQHPKTITHTYENPRAERKFWPNDAVNTSFPQLSNEARSFAKPSFTKRSRLGPSRVLARVLYLPARRCTFGGARGSISPAETPRSLGRQELFCPPPPHRRPNQIASRVTALGEAIFCRARARLGQL